MPGEVYGGGVLVAPAADTPDRRLAPARGPPDQSPGLRRWVSPVVQHQPSETSPSHPVPHALHAVTPPCVTGCPQSDVAFTHTTWSMCPKWLSAETRSAPVSIACAAIQTSFVGIGCPLALSDAMILE